MKVSECYNRPILTPCELENFKYQVDTYVGCEHFCYYCYVLAQAESDWSKEIFKHQDIVAQLSNEIENIPSQTIYMGYLTDPYQPSEVEHQQTRKVLELFQEKGHSASILTKSNLIIRDLDILKKMENAAVSVSVAFNDSQTRSLFEANTMETQKRIEALRILKEAGVRTGAMLCPVIPYITDAVQLINMLEPYTDVVWIYGLSIIDRSGPSWLNVKKILNNHFPDLIDQIEPVIFSKDHSYWTQLREELLALKNDRGLNLNIHL